MRKTGGALHKRDKLVIDSPPGDLLAAIVDLLDNRILPRINADEGFPPE